MNCPSRVDPDYPEGWNQNPNALNAGATTNADFDHIANAKLRRDHKIHITDAPPETIEPSEYGMSERSRETEALDSQCNAGMGEDRDAGTVAGSPPGEAGRSVHNWRLKIHKFARRMSRVLRKYAKFIGPGFMVSVAYIDPGMHFQPSSCQLQNSQPVANLMLKETTRPM
jgi:metal iron transporter